MKKRAIFLLILLFFIFSLILILKINSDKKEITGEATTQSIALNITVIESPPTLLLRSPKNHTYFSGVNILLNFTSNANQFWYKLDNMPDVYITGPTLFNSTPGEHEIRVFANNTIGQIQRIGRFYVNVSGFVIIDDHFEEGEDESEEAGNMTRMQKKGRSTDFLNFSYEEWQNLSNVIFENPSYAFIQFNSPINLLEDENPSDNILDINSHINTSFNRIYINTTALPNFNKPATLSLHDLGFTNPRILKDGVVCPEAVCTSQSYSGGILTFDVTGFSIYSAEETPVSASSSSSSTSGGGGGSITGKATRDFEINTDNIKLKLKQGESMKELIKIKNKGSISSQIFLTATGDIKNLVSFDEPSFIIMPREEKEIILNINIKEDTDPNLYIGKIKITGGGIEKEILVAIEVDSKTSLFDVKIEIPDSSLYVLPGENLDFNVYLYNLGGSRKVDVLIEYSIPDEYGNSYILEKETLAVETQASLIKKLRIPEEIPEGKQIIYVKITYGQEVASASSWFNVGNKPSGKFDKLIMPLALLIIILVLVGIILEIRNIKKSVHSTISEKELAKRGYIKKKK